VVKVWIIDVEDAVATTCRQSSTPDPAGQAAALATDAAIAVDPNGRF
jgi:hypothetical protein